MLWDLRLWHSGSGKSTAELPPNSFASARYTVDSNARDLVLYYEVKNQILPIWWANPTGDHLPSIACGRVPKRFHETASRGTKYGIDLAFPLCESPPAPSGIQIDKNDAGRD